MLHLRRIIVPASDAAATDNSEDREKVIWPIVPPISQKQRWESLSNIGDSWRHLADDLREIMFQILVPSNVFFSVCPSLMEDHVSIPLASECGR